MMSSRQKRQLIEAAFLPYTCSCTICPDGLVSIRVIDPVSDALMLEVHELPSTDLRGWSQIADFAANLQRKHAVRLAG
ncbi:MULTISPECIES: DUF1652 domain-containing protein [unclassified Pseudomonas]|uniref:DUF1652 domain-containing protein n=1 Tax=unclassified Pseudomonas TaxID=196821 RepID=UPI0005641A86|nr:MULTISPECIES: DUF1652 domain-containing protein [unclassified Pseudomonas]MBD9397970.1 DUF1652 domain-containing protein [Pseudomonas sp. PDM11]PZW71298.1 uncharacterized protein DUF1652 [Pseudomonas sp. URMO17WK12:I1]